MNNVYCICHEAIIYSISCILYETAYTEYSGCKPVTMQVGDRHSPAVLDSCGTEGNVIMWLCNRDSVT